MKKLAKNFLFQLIYQITQIILPIITIPIVSHSLGAKGLGMYNYVTSIVTYFILFAGLGLANYGIREVASAEKNKESLSKVFWELEFFNIIVVLIVLVLYMFFLLLVPNKIFFILSGITLFATLFDISWFFYGIEEFEKITVTNLFIKIASFIFIYLLIKEETDLPLYFFIQSISVLLSNIILWIFIKNKVNFVRVNFKEVHKHLKPALNFFLGKISIVLYTTMNKTLLGILGSIVAVGIYTNSLQVIIIVVTLIGTIDTVLMPHMTQLVKKNNRKELVNIMQITTDIQFFFSIPIFFGLILINEKMIPWFFGETFFKLNITVPILAPLIIIIPFGTAIARQYLLPLNEIKIFNLSVIYAAILALIVNLILIPLFGIWGAIVANILSEFTVTIYRYRFLKKTTEFRLPKFNLLKYFFSSMIMFFLTKLITRDMPSTFFTTIVQVAIGLVIYMFITYLIKCNKLINLRLREEK